MNKADGIIQGIPVEQYLGVRGVGQLSLDGFPVVIDVDGIDVGPGHHDLFDGHMLQIQHAHQHLVVRAGDERRRFMHHGAQLIAAQ